MKLNSLELENFKGIINAKFELDGKSTVFFGINGAGKSTTLRAVNLLFSNIINKIVQNRFRQGIAIDVNDIAFGKPSCKTKTEIIFDDGEIVTYFRDMERKSKQRKHGKSLDDIYGKYSELYFSENQEEKDIPIFVNYGVNRLVIDIPLRIRNKHIFDKLASFEKAIESKIDFRTFFEWFRYQEDIENQVKARGDMEYEDVALKAAKIAITKMLDGVTNLRIDRNPLAMKVDKNGISLRVDQLSDGEKCTLALIGDLSRRLALANPNLDNPNHGIGIVLIDEIELHMHPNWQRRIIPTLRDIYPNIQFIITTHSPQVLGEVGEDINIFRLSNENNHFVYEKINGLIGWDCNYILEGFMNTSRLNLKTKGKFDRMFELIYDKKFDEAKLYVDEIERMTDSAHEDVVKAKILIARGEKGI